MSIPFQLSRTHVEQALTAQKLLLLMIIRIGLLAGIVIFYFVIVLLSSLFTPEGYSQQALSLMDLLSKVHALFLLAAAAIAFFLSNLQLRPERLEGRTDIQSPEKAADAAVELYQTSSILLMVPLDAASFFGAAICMIGVQNGTIGTYPLYWLNAASALFMLMIGIKTFPTRERVLEVLESAFVQR